MSSMHSRRMKFARQFRQGAPEWMREYYRQARAIFKETRRAMDSCESHDGAGWPIESLREKRATDEFAVRGDRVYLKKTAAPGMDADAVFRLLEFTARHGIQPAAETERQLEAVQAAVAEFCRGPQALWPRLKAVLELPRADLAFRSLENAGLLSSLLPEWASIEGALDSGPDSLFTTDEHTLRSLERISVEVSASPDYKRFAAFLSGADDRALLLFALLLHHMRGNAAALAGDVATRVQMPAADREQAVFLIEHQGDLAEASIGRDLNDPATVQALARGIGTVERLKLLAAMTYADISSTYPEAVLPVRLEQLWRTCLAIERELTRGLESDRIGDLPDSLPAPASFFRGFPTRYLRARAAAEIEADAQLYHESRPTGVAVRLETLGAAYKLTMVARDRPALFASIAGAISSFGMDIVKAEAFSNAAGVILDSFVFVDPRRTLQQNPSEAERLQDLIRRLALGRTEARRLLRSPARRGRTPQSIEPQVRFDSEASETATLVEIVAEDRPGLLYSLANTFALNGCNIDVVLIDTRGNRAMDIFYVTQDGRQVAPELQALLEGRLAAACRGE